MGGHYFITTLQYVLIANSPQLIVTFIYYAYNGVLTAMLAAAECSSYGRTPKPLRVSFRQPGGFQRRTYWFSIPYHYSIPLLAMFMFLHWLISQSIFYVQLQMYVPQQSETGPAEVVETLG